MTSNYAHDTHIVVVLVIAFTVPLPCLIRQSILHYDRLLVSYKAEFRIKEGS
jgi:hypothetical protein